MGACMRKKKRVSYETRRGMSVGEIGAQVIPGFLSNTKSSGCSLKGNEDYLVGFKHESYLISTDVNSTLRTM